MRNCFRLALGVLPLVIIGLWIVAADPRVFSLIWSWLLRQLSTEEGKATVVWVLAGCFAIAVLGARARPGLLPATLLAGMVLIALAGSAQPSRLWLAGDRFLAFQSCLEILTVSSFVWVASRRGTTRLLRWTVALVGLVLMLTALLQVLASWVLDPMRLQQSGLIAHLLPVRDGRDAHYGQVRLSGLLNSPNGAAMILLAAWPFWIPQRWRGWPGVTVGLALGLTLVVLAFTYSRSGYLGLAVQWVTVLLGTALVASRIQGGWTDRLRAVRIPLAGCAIVAVCVLGALIYRPVAARVGSWSVERDASLGNRLQALTAAIAMVRERPLTGWGLPNYDILYAFFPTESPVPALPRAHSFVAGFAIEHGGLGLLLLGVIAGRLALVCFRLLTRHKCRAWRHPAVPCSLAWSGMVIPLIVNYEMIHLPVLLVMAALLSLTCRVSLAPVLSGHHRRGSRRLPRLATLLSVGAFAGSVGAQMMPFPKPTDLLARRLEKEAERWDVPAEWSITDTSQTLTIQHEHPGPALRADATALRLLTDATRLVQQGKAAWEQLLPVTDCTQCAGKTASDAAIPDMTLRTAVTRIYHYEDFDAACRVSRLLGQTTACCPLRFDCGSPGMTASELNSFVRDNLTIIPVTDQPPEPGRMTATDLTIARRIPARVGEIAYIHMSHGNLAAISTFRRGQTQFVASVVVRRPHRTIRLADDPLAVGLARWFQILDKSLSFIRPHP
ncbi:MAG: O-antigen ligase family protein [Candidatus Sumerlaeaceae bacterium]|nr:O-antigen ligase family protein [Candidatus Sumerlaeaceae bacterium]